MVLGLSILFLTGGIVTAFVYEVAADRRAPSQAAAEDSEAPLPNARSGMGPSGATMSSIAEPPFPDPGVPGWRSPQRISHYSRENLYVKIDGRAEFYLQLGMVAMTFSAYSSVGDPRRTVDVYCYDMGEPANASAVYRAEAPPDATPVAVGDEGYEAGGAVFFRKGADYVQVLPGDPVDADGLAARAIARRIADRPGRQAGADVE
jgi:hypothetical protein